MEIKNLGVTVSRHENNILLGVHKEKNIYYCSGKYGWYLKYDDKNFSIPKWAQQENLNEGFDLTHAIKIIDWKIKNPIVKKE